MKTVSKGQKFGSWEVIDPKLIRQKKNYYVLCYCHKYDNLRYVRVYNLLAGKSLGSYQGNRGWSTRTKHKTLPKYVHTFNDNNGHEYYRVIYKEPGTNNTRTIGYYKTLEEASENAEILN